MRKRLILLSIDLTIILIATLAAVLLRDNFEMRAGQFDGISSYLRSTLVIAAPVLLIFGIDRSIWRMSSMLDYLSIMGAGISTVMLSVGAGFLINRLDGVSRSLPVLQTVLIICGLVGVRVIARLHHSRRKRGRPMATAAMAAGSPVPFENILIVGLGRIAELYVHSVEEFSQGSKRIIGLVGLAERYSGRRINQHSILGQAGEIGQILQDLEVHGVFVDRIVLTMPLFQLTSDSRQALLEIVNGSNIKLEMFAEQFELAGAQFAPPATGQGPLDRTSEPAMPRQSAYWGVKRAIDATASLILAVALLPVFVVVAIAVAVDVGLPLLFWQQRPGAGKQPFKIYKFRTMRGAYDWNGNRLRDDQRSSPVGRLLRRSRLDELPQLLNILGGQMSFVGPRPLLAVDQCDSTQTRLLIRPGLTGWAQVNGGRLLSIPDKMALDLWYLQNASLSVDVHIVMKTVWMVLFGETRDDAAIARAHASLRAQSAPQAPAATLVSERAEVNHSPLVPLTLKLQNQQVA